MFSHSTLAVLIACMLSACSPDALRGLRGVAPTETTKSLDGVKYIAKSIPRGDDPSTYGQRTYTIDSESRVLLRFESLSEAQAQIQTTSPVLIRVYATDAAAQAQAVATLQACPIARDWMMAATWTAGHPFRGGSWESGGTLDQDGCVDAAAVGSIAGDCSTAGAVCFDVSTWYKSYVTERSVNFGHALISKNGASATIIGDGSASRGPRMQWTQ